jgi:hypothetical protein
MADRGPVGRRRVCSCKEVDRMNFRILAAAVSAAAIGSAAPAMAASILIDDFNVDQRVEDQPRMGEDNFGQVSGGDIIGGWRDLLVETDSGSLDAAELVARDSILEFNNVTGATGRGWVTYDGSNTVGDDASNVDTSGLGGEDLFQGGRSTARLAGSAWRSSRFPRRRSCSSAASADLARCACASARPERHAGAAFSAASASVRRGSRPSSRRRCCRRRG